MGAKVTWKLLGSYEGRHKPPGNTEKKKNQRKSILQEIFYFLP